MFVFLANGSMYDMIHDLRFTTKGSLVISHGPVGLVLSLC